MNRSFPKHRWFQFSLRTLLIAILVLSLPLSWFAVKMERAGRQKELTERIEQLWGFVIFDWEESGAPTPPYPAWLRGFLGDHFFCNVSGVIFVDRDFGDEEAACLKELRNLKRLELHYTGITDAGFEHIEGLAKLEVLRLKGTKISDAGLEHVKGLTNLVHLELVYTENTDAGLDHLKGLSRLKYLWICQVNVTSAGVKKLQEALPDCDIRFDPPPPLIPNPAPQP